MTRAASDLFPEPIQFNGDPPAMESVQSQDEEDVRERRWHDFISECRDFAESERDGYAAVLRAVSEAMKMQRDIWPSR